MSQPSTISTAGQDRPELSAGGKRRFAEFISPIARIRGINEPLRLHEEQVARDLEYLNLPSRDWVRPMKGPNAEKVYSAIVVGAGMNGLAAAASLTMKGVRDILILDRNKEGDEGPWLSTARMHFLRSVKTLSGPALGIPSLTVRAWFEALYGKEEWARLHKIPNDIWVDYLTWLRRVLNLPIEHQILVDGLGEADGLLKVRCTQADRSVTYLARRVVLATGRAGAGGLYTPDFVDRALWPDLAAHSYEKIDFDRLAGKQIAVIGGGSAAWDNAATAIERGAARVDMYVRKPHLPQVNKGRALSAAGVAFLHGWPALDDAERWRLFALRADHRGPPPHETVLRGADLPGLDVHFSTAVHSAQRHQGRVRLVVGHERQERLHDFLIPATGFRINVGMIAELAGLSKQVARWKDRHTPRGDDPVRPDLAEYPYLGPGFELVERTPGALPWLTKVHFFNVGAYASHGNVAADIPGVNVGAERLGLAIARSLFREDIGYLSEGVEAFDEPELEGTPYFVKKEDRIS